MGDRSSTQYNIACRRILEFLRSELSLSGCVLYNQQEGAQFIAGILPDVIEGESNSSLDNILNLQLAGGCACIVPDIALSAHKDQKIFHEFDRVSIVSTLIAPSEIFGNTLICGISFGRSHSNLSDQQSVLEFCARQIEDSIVSYVNRLDDSLTIESLTEQAYRDAMTGLLNRNGWEVAITTTIASGFEGHVSASVFVVDVDDLKALNDAHGHAAGDEAIRKVAVVLQQFFEPEGIAPFTDSEPFIARTGGDEFIGMLFDCDDEAAQVISLKITNEVSQLGYSVSIGSATCRHARKLSDAIINADEAMYTEKSKTKLKRLEDAAPLKLAS